MNKARIRKMRRWYVVSSSPKECKKSRHEMRFLGEAVARHGKSTSLL